MLVDNVPFFRIYADAHAKMPSLNAMPLKLGTTFLPGFRVPSKPQARVLKILPRK